MYHHEDQLNKVEDLENYKSLFSMVDLYQSNNFQYLHLIIIHINVDDDNQLLYLKQDIQVLKILLNLIHQVNFDK